MWLSILRSAQQIYVEFTAPPCHLASTEPPNPLDRWRSRGTARPLWSRWTCPSAGVPPTTGLGTWWTLLRTSSRSASGVAPRSRIASSRGTAERSSPSRGTERAVLRRRRRVLRQALYAWGAFGERAAYRWSRTREGERGFGVFCSPAPSFRIVAVAVFRVGSGFRVVAFVCD